MKACPICQPLGCRIYVVKRGADTAGGTTQAYSWLRKDPPDVDKMGAMGDVFQAHRTDSLRLLREHISPPYERGYTLLLRHIHRPPNSSLGDEL